MQSSTQVQLSASYFSLGYSSIEKNDGKNMALYFVTVHARIQKVVSEGVQL